MKSSSVTAVALALLGLAARASAQPASLPAAAATSTMTALSTATAAGLGLPMSLERGPWVVGEVLFFSGSAFKTDPIWRNAVRARRGLLYTKADLENDIQALRDLQSFDQLDPALYPLPEAPIPVEFTSISVSTSQVRLVFRVMEKAAIVPAPAAPKASIPPAAMSGVVLTPTAYRGAGKFQSPGLGLDINAAYFIGRLYGKNTFANSVRKRNYIDRLGVWLLTADGKMQVQSETKWRPALAAGVQGAFAFRDSPQPSVNTFTLSVPVQQKTTRLYSDAYAVMTKNIYGARASFGFMQGNMGDAVSQFSEFLSPQALEFYANRKGAVTKSQSIPFGSLFLLPKPAYPLGVEFMKFNGAPLNPILINFKLGYFLKLNFDVSVLKFDGGYDVLGIFQFRYNHFPRR